MIQSMQQADQMRHCCQQDQNVENLMGAPKYVEFPWMESFRQPCLEVQLAVDYQDVNHKQGTLVYTQHI